MNRRRLLVALAVMVPLALFIPSKIAASWRPVMLARIAPPASSNNGTPAGSSACDDMRASTRAVVIAHSGARFDLASRAVQPLFKTGVLANGDGEWRIEADGAPRLLVRKGQTPERAYPLPADYVPNSMVLPPPNFNRARVIANETRVELLIGQNYFRWDAVVGQLERAFDVTPNARENQAVTRDGEHIVSADLWQIQTLSTLTGEVVKRVTLSPAQTKNEAVYISNFGKYALYVPPDSNAMIWQVVETATARVLWTFKAANFYGTAIFSPDEKWLATTRGDRKNWEIRDARTGAILRTLPLVPGAQTGAFSPDGGALYSLADGTLYRQRAR